MYKFGERRNYQPGSVEERIEATFIPVIRRVVNLVKKEIPLVVVTGSCGIGKSESFIPLLIQTLRDENYNPIAKDSQLYWWEEAGQELRLTQGLEKENGQKVLIIDEAAHLIIRGKRDEDRKLLEISKKVESQVVAINAININFEIAKRRVIDRWVKSGTEVYGRIPPSIDIGSPNISKELARQLLLKRFKEQEAYLKIPVNMEIVEFIVENIPLKVGVMEILSRTMLGETGEMLENIYMSIANQTGRISEADIAQVRKRISAKRWPGIKAR